MGTQRDPIAVVEACYQLRGSEEEWLSGVARAARPLTGVVPEDGMIAYNVELEENGKVRFRNAVQVCGTFDVLSRIQACGDLLDRYHAGQTGPFDSLKAKLYQQVVLGALRAPCDRMLLSEIDKIGPDWMYTLDVPGIRDHFFSLNHHIDGLGATLLVGGLTARGSLSPAERKMFQMLGAHIKAGQRLRRSVPSALGVDAPAGGAVLDGNAGVVHAEGEATEAEAREELREAARRIDRARTRANGRDERALEVWQGLVQGRWSLVERFDSDGRRFLLAHKNVEDVLDPRGLSRMESRVVGLAVRGYSNKLIAYHLGISEGTVSSHLHRALIKLNFESRTELVKHLGTHYPQNTDPRFPVEN